MRRRLPWKTGAIALAVSATLVAAWWRLPVRQLADPQALARFIEPVVTSPWLPLIVLGAFIAAGAVMLSVWLVIFQTCLLYEPWIAFPLALGGATLSATTFFALGRVLGRGVVERVVPLRVQQTLEHVTLESIIAVRVLPLLPFTLVNLTCGAVNVPLRRFVWGTVLGMAPGVLGMTLVGDRMLAVIKEPTPGAIAGLVVVVVALVLVARFFRRRAATSLVRQELERDGTSTSFRPPPSEP
jgi:phospholipase D1/2